MSPSTPDISHLPDREGHFWDVIHGRVPKALSAELLGWNVLEVDPEVGRVRVEYEAKPEFLNPMGVVHGGFLAAMLDEAMGPALVCTLPPDHFNPTIELKVSFHRPARIGRLIGEAKVLQGGKTIGFVEGKLYDAEGKLVASATGTFRVLPAKAVKKD